MRRRRFALSARTSMCPASLQLVRLKRVGDSAALTVGGDGHFFFGVPNGLCDLRRQIGHFLQRFFRRFPQLRWRGLPCPEVLQHVPVKLFSGADYAVYERPLPGPPLETQVAAQAEDELPYFLACFGVQHFRVYPYSLK